ncbi:MAG: HtaA domain-containing protein [Solirubrobacterales bacterium]
MLPAAIMAAALFALLAFAPFASAASDPVASGTTTVKLNSGFVKKLKKNDIKVLKVRPAKLKGHKATFTVTGGELDPTTGLGTLTLSGGLKFKAGKRTAPVKALVVNTAKKSLTGTVAGKKMKVASITGSSFARNGFGVNLTIKSMKLTGKAAKRLNKKLGFSGNKGKSKRAATSKASELPFKGNQVLGSATSETQPSTVVILPGGNATLTTALPTVTKLAKDKVEIALIAPTTLGSAGPPPAFAFPISGGTISPAATAGIVQTAGGLKLSQVWVAGEKETNMTLSAIYVDLGAKTATVEVTVESKGLDPKLNLGVLGRSSIADISLTGATITADPATRTVSVQNATATLQAVTAEVLNSVFAKPFEAITSAKAETFAAGDPLGTFSFTAQTQ